MKIKITVLIFMILVSFFAKAEKTYRRDHAECTYLGEKIELDIRSKELYSPSEDDDYGEIIQLKHRNKIVTIKLNDHIGRYRFMPVFNDLCAKVMALPSNKNELIFFFWKDQRPMTNKVMALYFNVKSQDYEMLSTNIAAKLGSIRNNKAYFKLGKDNFENQYGTLTIKGDKYNFVEKAFEPWVSFDGKSYKLDPKMTYERFEYKDLLEVWLLDDIKDPYNINFKFALNPLKKKRCLSVNNSDWVCH